MSSLTNFAIGLVVARELGPAEFGAFSLAFATYLFVLNGSRGLATDALAVRFSEAPATAWRHAVAGASGTAIVGGLVVGACCMLVGAVLGDVVGNAFLSLGLVVPGLLLQDSWRYAFFASGRGRDAFVNDLVWAVALVPMAAAVIATGASSVQWFIIAWGGSATIAAVVGMRQARVRPQPSWTRGWLTDHRDLAVRYLSENLSFSAATQFRLYGLGMIAGVAAVGALRAAELLLGPVNLVIMGVGSLMAIPEAARLVQRDMAKYRAFIFGLTALLGSVAALCGAAFMALPDSFGVALLGASWDAAAALLLPVTIMTALLGVWSGAWTGMRAMGAARRSLRAQTIGSATFLLSSLIGAVVDGASGAAWGGAVGNLVAACVWWSQWHIATREFASKRTADPGPVLAHGA